MAARPGPPSLHDVLAVLEEIAPLSLAAEWDNTGLLVEPRAARAPVRRVALAIDLTVAVVQECRQRRVGLLVCYHPPVFTPLRRLSAADPRQRALLAATALELPVWSPHTALDAAPGGLNDWLAGGMAGTGGAAIEPCGEGGFGRLVRLSRAVSRAVLVARVRRLLRVKTLRIAEPEGPRRSIRSVAVCAGAGGSVLGGVTADALVTGEMRHHDVLAAVAGGTTVLLSEHTDTERPYLRVLQSRLRRALSGVDFVLCRSDRALLRSM